MSNSYHISVQTPFSIIDCENAFKGLNESQSLYAYNFAKASWSGAKICFFERSFQSPAFLYIILKAFQGGKISSKQYYEKLKPQLGSETLDKIYIYISSFFDNTGNFKSFGDSKFVPDCSKQQMRNFLLSSNYWGANKQEFEGIYTKIQKYIFAYDKPYELINFLDKNGTNGYYSSNITSEQAQIIKQVTIKKGLMSENNRLIKTGDKKFVIKIASQNSKQQVIQDGQYHITASYGQFSPFLKQVNYYLGQAKKSCASQNQQKMINQYIQHFRSGDMERHKQSQRYWIKDTQPIIETNIGFIESYLDPLKVRAEFQGFVAVVNQQQSKLLSKLVENAQTKFLKYLPWGQNFQIQNFKKPDFTSLEVLAFASSGIPIGINIPNYDDIRKNQGFKNVNLGNAYGKPTSKSIQYVSEKQIQIHLKYFKPSLFVQVALHQLLGHGSGRLFNEKPNLLNPIDNSQIQTFYGPNQTYHSVFGQIAPMYEQCRADSVGIFLGTFQDIQEVLLPQLNAEQRTDAIYVGWFNMILGGLKGMQYYNPENDKWLQAHIGGRFAIFRVLEEQGGVFQIKQTQRDGNPYLQVYLQKQAIKTKGRSAIGNFLKRLQIYKSTADAKGGQSFLKKYLKMNEKHLKYREIVIKNKKPRRISVQAVLQLVNGKPYYQMHSSDCFGCINSSILHFNENIDDIISEWNKNNQEFKY